MPPLKYNPVTNRFETAGGVDSPPNGFAPAGTQYVDSRTGETKLASGRAGVPDTVLKPAATTTVKPTTTTVKPTTTTVKPTASKTTTAKPTATKSTAGASAGGFRKFDQNTTSPVVPAYSQADYDLISKIFGTVVKTPEEVQALISGLDVTSTGGSGRSNADAIKAQIAADAAKAQRAANQRGAADLIKAGQTAQTTYNQMGEQQSADIMKRAGEYYGGQKTTALANIDAATSDFLKNLIAPSAYSNAPIAELTPQQQGLMQNLQAYGATGGQAAQQMSQDVANNKFMADLMRSSNKGLQSADTDYFNSLRNAATGGQMASRQGLENLITGLQGQAQSDADKLKRDYLLKGLEALISGQTNAANMVAGQ